MRVAYIIGSHSTQFKKIVGEVFQGPDPGCISGVLKDAGMENGGGVIGFEETAFGGRFEERSDIPV